MVRLGLSLLGSYRVVMDGVPLTAFESNKVRALLAYLAVEADLPHSRESLASLLWPDYPQQAAMTYLRNALADLRLLLGDRQAQSPYLEITHDQVQFNSKSDYSLDVRDFLALSSKPGEIPQIERAVNLYRGNFLEGFTLKDCPGFDDWCYFMRERLRNQASAALRQLADYHETRRDCEQAINYARRRIALEPWQEASHCQLIRLLAISGQRTAALDQYEICKRRLKAELDIEPSEETICLYKSIRDGKITGVLQEVPCLHNLPAQLTSFIGREHEVEQVKSLLETHRLVTLTGAGGTGKTRLALQVAERSKMAFLDGVWLAELAPLADPTLVVQTAASALGMQLAANPQALSFLQDYLQPKQLLLILDNCEHLVEACAQLAGGLLTACPQLVILATSRETLGVEGETFYRVPPLPFPECGELPSLEKLDEYAAIRLFVERAESASPGFQITPENAPAIALICQRLDGIPLAIELAAARVKLLAVEEITRRLSDRFHLLTGGSRTALPRYQTLRASIDWSYNLLSQAEKSLLQHLSAFAGSWALEAAEYVGCGEAIDSCDILDLLFQLVNKSLVSVDAGTAPETRYRMLETIRQYAHEKLVESGKEDAIRNRHLMYYVELSEKVEFEFHGPECAATNEQLEIELDNIRQALGWCLEGKKVVSWNPELGLRLASALGDYWYFGGRLDEGFQWLERLLVSEAEQRSSQPISTQRAKWRAKALQAAGYLAIWLRDYDKALAMSEESRDLFRELGSEGRRGYALALLNLAWLGSGGNFNLPAEALLEEAAAIFREVGDLIQGEECRFCRAIAAFLNNNLDLAKAFFEEDLVFRKGIGDQAGAANTIRWLGEVTFLQDDWERAKILYNESQGLFLQVKSKYDYLYLLLSLGDIERSQGNYDQVARYFQEALDLARKQGEISAIQSAGSSLGNLALVQGNYEEAARIFEQNLEFMRKYNHPTLVAFSLGDLGSLAWEKGDYKGAEQEFDEMLVLFRKMGSNQYEPGALFRSGRAAFAQGDYGRAREFFEISLELLQTFYPRNIPGILEALAFIEAAQDNHVLSTVLLGVTLAWHQKNHYSRTPKEHAMRKNAINFLQQTLGEEAFSTAWEEGQALSIEQAIAYTMEEQAISLDEAIKSFNQKTKT